MLYTSAWRVLTDVLGSPPPQLHNDDGTGSPVKNKARSKSQSFATMPPSDFDVVLLPEDYKTHGLLSHGLLQVFSSSMASPKQMPPSVPNV
jgi:hypothetical protein